MGSIASLTNFTTPLQSGSRRPRDSGAGFGGFGPAQLLAYADSKRKPHDTDGDNTLGLGEVLGAIPSALDLDAIGRDIRRGPSILFDSGASSNEFGPGRLLAYADAKRKPHDNDHDNVLGISELLAAIPTLLDPDAIRSDIATAPSALFG